MPKTNNTPSRRSFLATGAAATAATVFAPSVHAAGSDTLKIGIVGTGGRGKGAIRDIMIADKNAKLVAMCDIFPDFLESAHAAVKKAYGDRVDVPTERMYTGFDGYKQLIDNSGCDIVFLTTPPGFRPQQLAYAVEKGKHVFAEKPMAVDAPGVRSVIESARKAKEKNLMCASGYCYRYEVAKQETVKRIHDGMIGDVVNIQATYNTGPIWYRDVGSDWDEMKIQVRNWYYYSWLSGDFIVEQHCHNLDKAMWVLKDELPIAATGLGGRQVRTEAKYGNVYDHFSTIFEYKDGKRVFSYCRQMAKCNGEVSDIVFGTKGIAKLMPHTITAHGGWKWAYDGIDTDMYVQEHKAFVAALKEGKPINDMENAAKSSLMGILGREACYTGQRITWDDMMKSTAVLAPPKLEWGPAPVQGVPMPGKKA
jgi:myo-inositol 2-dehydrogenase / D-chiro-inositol 1-dehydrogenase